MPWRSTKSRRSSAVNGEAWSRTRSSIGPTRGQTSRQQDGFEIWSHTRKIYWFVGRRRADWL
jgi:hypothetical protein